jgi:hypothetical protein
MLSFRVDGYPQAVSICSTAMSTAFVNDMGSMPSEGLAAGLMLLRGRSFNAKGFSPKISDFSFGVT